MCIGLTWLLDTVSEPQAEVSRQAVYYKILMVSLPECAGI